MKIEAQNTKFCCVVNVLLQVLYDKRDTSNFYPIDVRRRGGVGNGDVNKNWKKRSNVGILAMKGEWIFDGTRVQFYLLFFFFFESAHIRPAEMYASLGSLEENGLQCYDSLRFSGEPTVLPGPALFSDTSIGDRRSPVPSLLSRSTVDILFVWTPFRAWVSSCACSRRSMWEEVINNMTAANRVKRNVNQGRTTAILTIKVLVSMGINNTQKKKNTYDTESAYKHSLYPGRFLQYWQCNLGVVFHPDRR